MSCIVTDLIEIMLQVIVPSLTTLARSPPGNPFSLFLPPCGAVFLDQLHQSRILRLQ